jgi:acyl-CoA reductase-like NAD-dependent aldehyde dehydrogenase
MGVEGRNLIGGEWVQARSGQTFESVDPARPTEVLGRFPRSGSADIDAAVLSARQAFPAWRKMPAQTRATYLLRAAAVLRQRRSDLARAVTSDTGKVLRHADFEVQEAIDAAEYAAGFGRWPYGETVPSELPDRTCLTWREPLGVVGLITPGAFPVGPAGGRMFNALVAGNAVVARSSQDSPLASQRLFEAILEAGFPAGLINLVHGHDDESNPPLLAHPDVNGISFTGLPEAGRAVALECGRHLKRLGLVLASKNTMVVAEDADLERAVESATWAGFGATGQRTTAASRVIVHRARLAEFTERFVARANSLRVGNGFDDKSDLGPLVNLSGQERARSYADQAVRDGARVATGGRTYTEGPLANGYFFPPTVLTNVTPVMRVAQDVIYAPIVGLIAADSLEQALQHANSTSYGLVMNLYTRDLNRAIRAARELQSGIVYVNTGTQGEVHMPFGGTKASGNGGRTSGSHALDEFTELKAVYVDHA